MGSAGIAIGPDGKPLKRQEKRSQPARGGIGKPGRGSMGGGMGGRPMRGGAPPLMSPGFGRPGPSPFRGDPYAMGGGFGRGPMPFGGPPGGPMGGMGYGGPGNQNVSFFKTPQPVGPPMGDARTGPMQSGQQMTPSAGNVGRGPVGATGGAASSEANNGSASNTANEVPGFGTNSSIHELFGKMVWKKMEGLRDETVIDRLQNRIMNMIHEALAQQSGTASSGGGSNQGGAMNGHSGGGFRSF